MLSGISLGFSYLSNTSGVFLFLFYFLYIIIQRKFKFAYALIPVGFLFIFSLETIIFYLHTNEWFFRFSIFHAEELRVVTNTDMNYYPRVLFNIHNPNFFAHEGHFGFFAYLLVPYALFLLYKRDKISIIFFLFLIIVMLYLQFGIMTFTGKPIAKWVRYLVIFVPFISIISSRSTLLAFIDRRFKYPAIIILLFLLVTTPYYLIKAGQIHQSLNRDWLEIVEYIKPFDKKTIFTDLGSFGYIDAYLGYSYDVKALEEIRYPKDIINSYVIIDGSRGIVENNGMKSKLPDFIRSGNIPESWVLLKVVEGQNEGIYSKFNPRIYYAP